MLQPVDTTAWLSVLSKRKLQASPARTDKLLRKVLLRNSISRVDLALAEAQLLSPTTPSPREATPAQSDPEPSARADEDEFVFPDATSLTARVYSVQEEALEARWLDSVLGELGDLSDDDDDECEEDSKCEEDADFDLDWLISTSTEEAQPIISVPSPTPPTEPLNLAPFEFPLPEDDDDDLSTVPDSMEDDEGEGESEADSLEWPLTPGQRSMAWRSTSNSALNQVVASAGTLPSITEDATPTIHFDDEPRLYRYSPALNEQHLISPATSTLGPSC